MVKIDETNLQILQLLQRDGRMTHAALAQAVGRSESTVRERVAALEMDGYLLGYEARVDWAKAGLPRLAILRASLGSKQPAEMGRLLAAIPNVTEVLMVTGKNPLRVTLRVRDVNDLDHVMRTRIAPLELQDVEVQIVMQNLVDRRPPALLGATRETGGMLDGRRNSAPELRHPTESDNRRAVGAYTPP